MRHSENSGTRFSTIVSLFAAGAAFGILFAPDNGRNTRRKIRREFDDMKDNLEDTWSEQKGHMQHRAEDIGERVQDKAEDIGERAQDKAEDISSTIEDKTHS